MMTAFEELMVEDMNDERGFSRKFGGGGINVCNNRGFHGRIP